VLAGLIAAEYGGSMPMAFLSAGGIDGTEGVAPVSRIDDLGFLRRFGRPNDAAPDQTTARAHDAPAKRGSVCRDCRARWRRCEPPA
jgi:hypothetical protein